MTDVTGTIHQYFEERGHACGGVLGRGMEGIVYDLGDDAVGKVWFRRRPHELRILQDFYRELGASPAPIRFPEILEVDEVDDAGDAGEAGEFGERGKVDRHAVTIERKLTGTTLRERLNSGAVSVEQGRDCTLEVLAALREIPGGDSAKALPVVDEPQALWASEAEAKNGGDVVTWAQALSALVERRVALFGDQLRRAVSDFDIKLAGILTRLHELPERPIRALHGDLVPENILVDDACRPLALLDWGFLSTAGDPAFEAALAAGLFDMYGEGARENEAVLLTRIQDAAGYPLELMHLYRAVYAVVTSNVYDPQGQDGHFAWCAASLERDDIAAAL